MKYATRLIAVCLALGTGFTQGSSQAPTDSPELTVYIAKKIITMEPAMPSATAVAVAEGKIVSVGSLDSLEPWMRNRTVTIDGSFKDRILMPGFIDPHVHPALPAALTQFPFIAPDDWSLPTGEFPGAHSPNAYIKRLQELVEEYYSAEDVNPAQPFITWGYHQLWHGDIYRQELDALFPDRAVILWHRSFHELIFNTAAIKLVGIDENKYANTHGVDIPRGHFFETGAKEVFANYPRMQFMMQPANFLGGMENFFEMLHRGGVTSALDMGVGIMAPAEQEIALIKRGVERTDPPVRIVLTPLMLDFVSRNVSPEQALKDAERWACGSTDKVIFDRHFKVHVDGAAFSGLGQMSFPGYIDGHRGEWMASFDDVYAYLKVFWNAGYQIHAHVNGDESTARYIELVEKLQQQKPRLDHRATLEHFMYAREEQLDKMKTLGISVSANPYYNYLLADIYADQWLGEDRAKSMVPLGAAERAGVRIGLHSDAPMAPLRPLTLAWTAVNRSTVDGNKNHQSQALSVHQALRAITIDAAWLMRWEDRVGSIRAGKNADFVVLEQDPYKVPVQKLKDIKIWGTVFEGRPYPISH